MRKRKLLAVVLAFGLIMGMIVSPESTALASGGKIDPDVLAASAEVGDRIQEEGIVLLKNENNVLPLGDRKVNVFGVAAAAPFYGSSGSGSVSEDNVVTFFGALDEAGVKYNPALAKTYLSYADSIKGIDLGVLGTISDKHTKEEMNIDKADLEAAAAYSDIAIAVIGRCGSEGYDLKEDELRLSLAEKAMINALCFNFEHVIVIFNTANIMEMGFLDEHEEIEGALMIWNPGEVGMNAVARVLKGEANPSGRLTDTVAYSVNDHPSTCNFGDFSYTDADGNSAKFVEYEEGIYIGYRYFETFGKEVRYPFGYGLSYTDFEWSDIRMNKDGDSVTISLDVTNTGDMAGKDVAEVYVSVPYIAGGLEKSSIQLAAYVKTDLLEPGETGRYEAGFNLWDVSSYDSENEEAWVLDEGEYRVFVSRDVKNKVKSFSFNLSNKMVRKNDEVTGTEIKNLFDDVSYDGMKVLSRNDPKGTFPEKPEANASSPVSLKNINEPVYNVSFISNAPKTGAKYEHTILLSEVYANPSLEEKFLDQLTVDEMIGLICDAGYKTNAVDRLGIVATADNDGPAAVKGAGGLSYKDSGLAWPAAVCLAATWNDELAYEMGRCCGAEAKAIGTDVWYAPAANLHRNPLGGRNFEYYSEDPLICGNMSNEIVKGAQEQKVIVTVKHFALNEQETNRWWVMEWADEQTMREIYLRPFEKTVKDGKAKGIMSAYDLLGLNWCSANSALLNSLLREEWGFNGCVWSDYSVYGLYGDFMNPMAAVYNGCDLMLTGLYAIQQVYMPSNMKGQYGKDPVGFGNALRRATRNIIRMKMDSLAFDKADEQKIKVEGETATVAGKTNKGSTFYEKADDTSNGMVLSNFSVKNNKATWTITASKDGNYEMYMRLADTHLLGWNVDLGSEIRMELNGEEIDLHGITIKGAGWLSFNKFDTYGPINVELRKGENVLTWTVIGGDAPNVDYFEFNPVD
ncbi:MAG: glycoside hydrolase family 3 C-terminal domain-containing protein [Lachnospiraceae bacterium]|nr:glycoside hydrolase family 3 C-terminal domain-containing protein [Lachnospiraceae bacterium]